MLRMTDLFILALFCATMGLAFDRMTRPEWQNLPMALADVPYTCGTDSECEALYGAEE